MNVTRTPDLLLTTVCARPPPRTLPTRPQPIAHTRSIRQPTRRPDQWEVGMVWALAITGFSEEEALYMRKHLRGGENQTPRRPTGPGPSTHSNDDIGHIPFSCKDLKEEMLVKTGSSANLRSQVSPTTQARVANMATNCSMWMPRGTLRSTHSKLNSTLSPVNLRRPHVSPSVDCQQHQPSRPHQEPGGHRHP